MVGREMAEDGGVPADITDMLHDRAIVWLRMCLRGARQDAARGHGGPDDPVDQAGREGTFLAMEHVGAITAAEAASWRQRLHEAATGQEPPHEPPPEEVVGRAVAHLEGLLAPVSPSTREGAAACFSAIVAYEKAGVLHPGEALAWRQRLRMQSGLRPERPPQCAQRDLVRVVPGPDERMRGLRITGVELYGDGVVLHWHSARRWPEGPETPRIWNDMDMDTAGTDDHPRALTDDLGTRYVGGGGPDFGINGGGWVVRFGASAFTPAVPAGAGRLQAPLRGGGIDIDL
jgi:hypothetical protein